MCVRTRAFVCVCPPAVVPLALTSPDPAGTQRRTEFEMAVNAAWMLPVNTGPTRLRAAALQEQLADGSSE